MATEKQLFAAIRSEILAGFVLLSISGIAVKQAYQPTQQGAPVNPTVFMTLVSHRRIGSVSRFDTYDTEILAMVHAEKQQYETTFQINALATQNPPDTAQLTAGDIINNVAYILQSSSAIVSLQAQDIGILRITDVRNPQFNLDRDQFQSSPSFDITFTHKLIVTSQIPVLQSTELQIYEV